ncbi:hypothetical protein [Cohnella thermotolerans]|uniref:hypothetical protein n=1 Tax=Cohnella thermotolerans TaxID=329858 RepID=UPI00047A48B6|nr:hypothetical protein [Cohnella thermotolerans]
MSATLMFIPECITNLEKGMKPSKRLYYEGNTFFYAKTITGEEAGYSSYEEIHYYYDEEKEWVLEFYMQRGSGRVHHIKYVDQRKKRAKKDVIYHWCFNDGAMLDFFYYCLL